MTPIDYIDAARVPKTLKPQEFGLWKIERIRAGGQKLSPTEMAMHQIMVGYPDYTLLRRVTMASIHMGGEIVMEDGIVELSKHLPIWIAARGLVLITGLGLGCVVRGLLVNPRVDHVTVIEIDQGIIDAVGPEFDGNPRVTIYQDDALKWDAGDRRFDFAWHDLWCEGEGLHLMHAELFIRHRKNVGQQGAWAFPRDFAKLYGRKQFPLLGAPKQPRNLVREKATSEL